MKRLSILSALSALFIVAIVRADEPPDVQLEFVRKLRDKGYADLALEHIEKLRKTHPSLAQALGVETARANIALARDKEPDQRQALYNAAKTALEAYVAKAKGAEAAKGRLELAHLAVLQGQAMLRKALRLEDVKMQQSAARRAEVQFAAAGELLDAAAKALVQAASAENENSIKKQLNQDAAQARFDRAISYLDQARTYIDLDNEAVNKRRAELVGEAKNRLETIVTEEAGKGDFSLLAKAWLVKCHQEKTEPLLAAKYLKEVLAVTGKAAQPAQRWAKLFKIQGLLRDPSSTATPLQKHRQIQKEGQDWLKEYPAHKNSPEGYAVRYQLGLAYFNEAQLVSPKDPKAPGATALYTLAQKYFTELAGTDSDFAEKANQLDLEISLLRIDDKTPIDRLKDFEECFLRAHYEMSQMRQAAAKLESATGAEAEKLRLQREAHQKDMVRSLLRALEVADPRTPPQKLAEARYLLTVAYLISGDVRRAAEAGEAVARQWPRSKRATVAAGYALEAYAHLAAADPKGAARAKLRELAAFVLSPESQKLWQGDPVISVALYQLAMSHRQENNPKQAIALLEKLPADFSGYIYAQGQLVFVALDARDKASAAEDKKYFEDKARAVLKGFPALPGDADPSTATMYFYARLEQAKLLYADGRAELTKQQLQSASVKFLEMAKATEQLQEQFDKLKIKLTEDTTNKIRAYMAGMQKYALLGQADTDYRAGNYDKIILLVSKPSAGQKFSLLEELKLRSGKDGKIRMKDHQLSAELLGLALRAQVQKGKIEDAKGLLALLKRLTSEEGALVADPTATLRALVTELDAQVKDLKKSGDSLRLKTTVANFSAFLDELASSADKKTMEAKDYLFLANCYDSLSQHAKAAKLYAEIAPPTALDKVLKPREKLSDEDEQNLQTYWYAQVKLAEQLRLLNELKEAKKTLDRLQEHPNKRMTLLAEKEQLHLLEANQLWGSAATRWQQFQNNPALKNNAADDPALKKLYFEAYYHLTYCTYKFSQTPKGKMKEAAYLKSAANNVLRLEKARNPANPEEPGEGWQMIGARFQELLAAEAPLRNAYEQLKRQ